MARQQKCAKCGQGLVYFTLILWNGPNGFRRYALCDKCRAEILEHESKGAWPCAPTKERERREKVGRN